MKLPTIFMAKACKAVLACTFAASLVPACGLSILSECAYASSVDEISTAAICQLSDDAPSISIFNSSASQFSLLADLTIEADCGNGWQLNFSVGTSEASVLGVVSAGSGALVIPASAGGQNVTSIGDGAFQNVSALTSVTLPSTVISIGTNAFRNTGLVSFVMPDSVTTLGESALRDNAYLKSCTLSSALTTIGSFAFKMDTSLTSITLPAQLNRVSYGCFAGCTALASVTFEGSSMRYLHREAFMNCTSLTEIEIPLLTACPTTIEAKSEALLGNSDFSALIGARCFYGCTNLSKIVLDGPVVPDSATIFAGSDCLLNCAKNMTLVFKGVKSAPSYGSSTGKVYVSNEYCTLDFYNSESDASALTNKVASATYNTRIYDNGAGTVTTPIKLLQLISGAVDYSQYAYTADTAIPTAPSGKVWGVLSHPSGTTSSSSNQSSYAYYNDQVPFYESYQVVAADKADVYFGWVDSPLISAYYNYDGQKVTSTSDYGSFSDSTTSSVPTFSVTDTGICSELDNLVFRAADGSVLNPSSYQLHFEKANITTTVNGGFTNTSIEWEAVSRSEVNAAGTYRVYATGVGQYAARTSSCTQFVLSQYTPSITSYANASSLSAQLGAAATDIGLQISSSNTQASYTVMAAASDGAAQLVAAGVAGAASVPGLVLVDNGQDYSATNTRGHIYSGSGKYIIVGNSESVPLSTNGSQNTLADYVFSRCTYGGTRFGEGTSTAQQLASYVNLSFNASNWGASWGSTIIVANADDTLAASGAMQYVYENAAQVFFLNSAGSLDSADLAAIKAANAQNIVLLGDSSSVSDVVASILQLSTGKTPTRIMEDSNATQGSIDLASAYLTQKYGEGSSNTTVNFVIADASDVANCTTAAVLAHWTDAVVLTCASSADITTVQSYLSNFKAASSLGLEGVGNIYTIGTFDYAGTSIETALSSALSGGQISTALSAGSTFELDGAIYKLEASGGSSVLTAAVSSLAGMLVADIPSQVTVNGATYKTSVSAENAFADLQAGAWYLNDSGHNWIDEVFSKGIMSGYSSSNNFGPDDSVTRAQVATILYRYSTGDAGRLTYENASGVQNTSGLTDVADGQYYTAAVNWAVQNGIVTGYDGAGIFCPNSAVTRQELAVMLARFAKFTQGSAFTPGDTSAVLTKADGQSVASWALDGFAWCVSNGVISGMASTGALEPNGVATRAQMAKMVCVVSDLI